MFCAPTATLDPLQAGITVGSNTGEGNSAISSRVCPATSGKKASTNAVASAGVLYIFQLAAISALRAIFWFPQLNSKGLNSAHRMTTYIKQNSTDLSGCVAESLEAGSTTLTP